MKIGIISDTHDRAATIEQALELFAGHSVGLIVHCGDWTSERTLLDLAAQAVSRRMSVIGVLGNRDDQPALYAASQSTGGAILLPANYEIAAMELGNRLSVIYHGHHKPTLSRLAADPDIDVLFTGHTHKPLIYAHAGKLIVNPGSTAFSIPRSRTPRSVAIYDSVMHTAELHYFEADRQKAAASGPGIRNMKGGL